jgi:4-carboxymuconolactone decarboxylase
VSLCFLFRGLSAANRGAEILANLARREREADQRKADE